MIIDTWGFWMLRAWGWRLWIEKGWRFKDLRLRVGGWNLKTGGIFFMLIIILKEYW